MMSMYALLQNAIDYAGLFPPAGLPMREAVANYARYRAGDDSWALGRFVVPAARLTEFESVARDRLPRDGAPWRLSALGGDDLSASLEAIRAFNDRHRPDSDNGAATIDTVEVKATTVEDLERITMIIGNNFETYVETRLSADLPRLIEAIRAAGLRAKIRTGGVTADAIPAPEEVLRFMALCVAAVQGDRRPAPPAAIDLSTHLRAGCAQRDDARLSQRLHRGGATARGRSRRGGAQRAA
jgi:hypothetical protein